MYKLLIVDDDMLVRIDISTLLDWEKLGVQPVGEAANGIEALKLIDLYYPDIIILDLGMPLMDGIEVIRKLKESNYNGKILVLSCHDDFESVKEAMKLGAVDYIRKHLLDAPSLLTSVKNVICMLECEDKDRKEKNRLQRISKQSIAILKDRLVKGLVSGELVKTAELDDILVQLDMEISFTRYAVIVVEIDDLPKLQDRNIYKDARYVESSLQKLIDEVAGNRDEIICGHIDDGTYCIIVNFGKVASYMEINSKLFDISNKLLVNAKNFLNLSVSVGISKLFTDMSYMNDCFKQARQALNGKLYFGRNRIIHYTEVENFDSYPKEIIRVYEKEIYNAVKTGEAAIESCISKLFAKIRENNMQVEYIRIISLELLVITGQITNDFKFDYNEIFECDYLPYHRVMSLETIEDIQQWFTTIGKNIVLCLKRRNPAGKNEMRPEIRKSLIYIEKNYSKNISLREISDVCNISSTYFCKLFKLETGESFIDYLCRYRIEKAKQMLDSSGMKVYEVGLACGFKNYRYFTRLFKKYAEISPGKFKDNHEDNIVHIV